MSQTKTQLVEGLNINTSAPADALAVDSSGRVGIGTSSPANDLDVLKTASGSTTTARIGATAASGANNATLILNNGGTGNATLRFDYEGSTNRASIGVLASDQKLTFGTAGSTAMTIDASQRVGIGTTSPIVPLHIAASAATLRLEDTDTNSYAQVLSDNNGSLYLDADAGNSQGSSSIRFRVDFDEKARIDTSGRLLVGTSTARSNLQISTGFGSVTPNHQIETSTATYGGLSIINNATSYPAVLSLGKSRSSGGIGSNGIVSNGDIVGMINFYGNDDSKFVRAATIAAEVDGTPGTNDMPGRLVFSCTPDNGTTPTERMRISSNSTYFFNTTSAINYGQTNDTWNTGSGTAGNMCFRADNGALILTNKADNGFSAVYINKYDYTSGTGDDDRFIDFRLNGGAAIGEITVNATSNGVNYTTTSDYRLKENVVALTNGIDRLKQLNVNRFNFISNPDYTVDGFIAHEVQAVVPEAITGEKDAVDNEGNPKYQGIDQSKLVPLLTAALQEAIAKIETLEANNIALEARLAALEAN